MKHNYLLEKLRTVFIRELQNKNYSDKTIKVYTSKIEKFILRVGNPYNSSKEDISIFINKQIGEVSKRQSYSAIKLLYVLVLKRDCPYVLQKMRKSKKLPVILFKNEVLQILNTISNFKHYTLIAMIYGSGLRVSEIVNLKVRDLDFQNLRIIVRNAKGRKDRLSVLSKQLISNLHKICKDKIANDYVFTTQSNKKYSIRTVQKIFQNALKKSGIKKHATCHTLRHSFATHLIQNGMPINIIKKLLGHKSIKTTMIYLHITNMLNEKIESPL